MDDDFLSPTLPEVLPANPMVWASAWFNHAGAQAGERNPNAMTLASVATNGQPSARVVLCKSFVADPGYIVFYTNYRSRKVTEISAHPQVAATFHWDALGRQVRIEGLAVNSPAEESDAYFSTRHWGSQIGAWGSDQSMRIESREALVKQIAARARSLGVEVADDLQSRKPGNTVTIARPAHWGGIRIWPASIELWIEGSDRVHDRALWTRSLAPDGKYAFDAGAWSGVRLQP